ncbi:MAG TPA: CPBP family intramembrane metalloprotease [Chloroflexi bacterium]|nr:CPBP family intramembrane metalloprotease [Chloroflexota bacterium]
MMTDQSRDVAGGGGGMPPGFAVRLTVPLPHNEEAADDLIRPPLPAVDARAARRPVTPGLPPLPHPMLPRPDALKMSVPGAQGAVRPGRRVTPGERVNFPVAEPPPVKPLTDSPPPVAPPADEAVPGGPSARQAVSPPVEDAEAEEAEPVAGLRIDPLFGFVLFGALALGTLYLDIETRYTVLWTALILLGMTAHFIEPKADPQPFNLIWGAGVGFVFSLPLLVLAGRGLAETAAVLFPFESRAGLFQALVFAMPLGETIFFRGALQERYGFTASVAGAMVGSALLFWPAASGSLIYLVAGMIFSSVLAGIYSYVRSRYGLMAAYICQVTANLMLLFLPGFLP